MMMIVMMLDNCVVESAAGAAGVVDCAQPARLVSSSKKVGKYFFGVISKMFYVSQSSSGMCAMRSVSSFLERNARIEATQKVPKNSSSVPIPNTWMPSTDWRRYLYMFF